MRKVLITGLVFSLLTVAVVAANTTFIRRTSITGGSAQQLSSVLSTAGFTGTTSLQELTLRNPPANANDLCIGQSDVSASTGLCLQPGESLTMRAVSQQDAIYTSQIYLYVSSTQDASILARDK